MAHRQPSRARFPPECRSPAKGATTDFLLAALGLAVVAFPSISHSPLPPTQPAAFVGASVAVTLASSPSCSDPSLTGLTVSPNSAHVAGLHAQTFSATALGSCGGELTNRTVFTWALSSSSLGALSSTTGASTTYTACLAQMSGLLRLTGTYDGVVLRENVTLSISYASSGGSGPQGGESTNLSGTNLSAADERWAGAAVAVLLVTVGILLVIRTARRGRRETSDKGPREDSQPPELPLADSSEESSR